MWHSDPYGSRVVRILVPPGELANAPAPSTPVKDNGFRAGTFFRVVRGQKSKEQFNASIFVVWAEFKRHLPSSAVIILEKVINTEPLNKVLFMFLVVMVKSFHDITHFTVQHFDHRN